MPDQLSALTGPAGGQTVSGGKRLKKVGKVWSDDAGMYYTDSTGSGTAFKTQAEAERSLGTTNQPLASAMEKSGQQAQGKQPSAMDADPALAEVAKLAENEKWADAWQAIDKLDKKKYANDPGYQKLYKLVKDKAGL